MSRADQLGSASKFGAGSGCHDLRDRLTAPHQRPGAGLHAGASLDIEHQCSFKHHGTGVQNCLTPNATDALPY
jgi:hypothetical protein